MQIKCGTDIIEISRVQNSIENLKENFLERVFTPREIEYCEGHGNQKYQHYAARFAAKEAAFKAVSEVLSDKYELTWTDYEVYNDENGKPHMSINLKQEYRNQIENIDVSLSHSKEFATANVTILIK